MIPELSWNRVDERHLRAESEFGPLWIRLDRSGEVSGLYTCFGETSKWCPESEEEGTLNGAKVIAELLLAGARAAREIENRVQFVG